MSGLSCFGAQKGGKRVAPASRVAEGNASATALNGPQVAGLTNQTTSVGPSLLAPPSSPASFSALPSTAQSPNCYLSLSANSPGGPSSTMYATGPYAHETQLVSPPVFSTFTTEPSTAPLTPPPELAHLTTPSSPDVPYAQLLSSSVDLKGVDRTNYISSHDLQASYQLYPGSPASSLRSPISRTSGECLSSSFPERDSISQWDPQLSPQNAKYPRNGSGRLFGHDSSGSMPSQDTNFFCPETFAQFYLDLPHSGGRLSVSKDSDVNSNCGGRLSISKDSEGYSNGGNRHQARHIKNPKQDVEEVEAYRASFGFSADEVITTSHYVEISDVMDESFFISPFAHNKLATQEVAKYASMQKTDSNSPGTKAVTSDPDHVIRGADSKVGNKGDYSNFYFIDF